MKILRIEELVDGRVFVEWKALADDGLPLTEGSYFEINGEESIEDCVERNIIDVRVRRERINANPKVVKRREPRRKRTTRKLDDAAAERLADRLSD